MKKVVGIVLMTVLVLAGCGQKAGAPAVDSSDIEAKSAVETPAEGSADTMVDKKSAEGSTDAVEEEQPAEGSAATVEEAVPKPGPVNSDRPPVLRDTEQTKLCADLAAKMGAGDVMAVRALFDANMRKVMPGNTINEFWADAVEKHGAFKSVKEARQQEIQGYHIVFVTCEFEKGDADLQFTINVENEVAGLYLRDAGYMF